MWQAEVDMIKKLIERLKDKLKPTEKLEEPEYASEPDCADCPDYDCVNPWICNCRRLKSGS